MTTLAPRLREATPPVPPDLVMLAMVAIWGVNFSVSKRALAVLHPLAFNGLRFPFAALVVLAALRSRGPFTLPAREDRWRIIGLGLLGNVIYQQFFILGLDRTRAGTASLLLASTPILTALLSAALGHERVGRRAWIGVSGTVLGIALVAGTDSGPGGSTAGNLLMIGSSVAWAGYTVAARPLIQRYGPIRLTAWSLVAGTIGIVLLGLPAIADTDLGAIPLSAWLAVLYAGGLSIGAAYLMWNYGVRHIGNTRTAVYSNLVPVCALVVAWLWLRETPTLPQIVGATVIIAGVSVVQRRSTRRPMGVRT